MQATNKCYTASVDLHHRIKVFSEVNLIMVHLNHERYPSGTYNKLKAKKVGPIPIIKRINDNAYVMGFPTEWKTSNTFNVKDLFEFYSPDGVETIEQN